MPRGKLYEHTVTVRHYILAMSEEEALDIGEDAFRDHDCVPDHEIRETDTYYASYGDHPVYVAEDVEALLDGWLEEDMAVKVVVGAIREDRVPWPISDLELEAHGQTNLLE